MTGERYGVVTALRALASPLFVGLSEAVRPSGPGALLATRDRPTFAGGRPHGRGRDVARRLPDAARDLTAEAGLLLRGPTGRWTLQGRPDREPDLADLPSPLPEEQLTPVETVPAPDVPDEGAVPSAPVGSPTPAAVTCPSPATCTVTPHSANGPPTTYALCPS